MATIIPRKGRDGKTYYQARVRLTGHPPESERFSTKRKAERWAQRTEADLRDGKHVPKHESQKTMLAECIDRYMADVLPHKSKGNQVAQGIQLDWWRERLGDHALADITTPMIISERDRLLREPHGKGKKPRSNSTANRYMAALSIVFTTAINQWQLTDANPCAKIPKLKEPKGRVRFLSDDERNRLLSECKKSRCKALYPFVVLALSTGARRGEIMALQWPDVDFQRRWITLHDTKNDERRGIPLTGHAHDMLAQWAAKRDRIDTNLVFPGDYKPGEETKPLDIRSAWRSCIAKAGVENFRLHDCRHSAASYLLMNGATLGELSAILGHKQLDMVKRYAHISDDHVSRVVERMNNAVFADEESEADHG